MTDIAITTKTKNWSATQAVALALGCLVLGSAGGWLLRQSQSPTPNATTLAAAPAEQSAPPAVAPTPDMLKGVADSQAAPLLEQLKGKPDNAELLARLGDIYFDARSYSRAIDYYQRSLKLQPGDASTRTDMATAYWYSGNADIAIMEFQKALSFEPNKGNALFNLGIVKWQGKHDAPGAIAEWQKLLATNPNYEARSKVEDLIAQAKSSLGNNPQSK